MRILAGGPGRRGALLALAGLVLAAGAYAALAPPRRPSGVGCRLEVALGVPRLEAAPVLLAAPVRMGGRTCRLALARGAAARAAPLALLPGGDWAGSQADAGGRTPFLMVAERAGALLLARSPVAPHFLWHDTAEHVLELSTARGDLGATVAGAMLAVHAVRAATVLRGLGARAFLEGTGDYLELPLWPAERLIVDGRAHFAADLAVQGGPVPAAVLAVSPAFAKRRPALLNAIALHVTEAAIALSEQPARQVARWPTRLSVRSRRALLRALVAARAERLWATDPRVERTLFVRLDVLRRAAGEPPLAPPEAMAGPAEAAARALAPPRASG